MTFLNEEVIDFISLGFMIRKKAPVLSQIYEMSNDDLEKNIFDNFYIEKLKFDEDEQNSSNNKFWAAETMFLIDFLLNSNEIQNFQIDKNCRLLKLQKNYYRFQLEKYVKCEGVLTIKICMKDIISACKNVQFVKNMKEFPKMITVEKLEKDF